MGPVAHFVKRFSAGASHFPDPSSFRALYRRGRSAKKCEGARGPGTAHSFMKKCEAARRENEAPFSPGPCWGTRGRGLYIRRSSIFFQTLRASEWPASGFWNLERPRRIWVFGREVFTSLVPFLRHSCLFCLPFPALFIGQPCPASAECSLGRLIGAGGLGAGKGRLVIAFTHRPCRSGAGTGGSTRRAPDG